MHSPNSSKLEKRHRSRVVTKFINARNETLDLRRRLRLSHRTPAVRSNPGWRTAGLVFTFSVRECCWGVCVCASHALRLSNTGAVSEQVNAFNRSWARVIFSATCIPAAVRRIVSSFRYFDGPFKQRQSQRNAFRGNFVYNSPIAPRYIKTCGFSCTFFNIWVNWHLKIFGVTRDVTRSTLWRYWDLWKNFEQYNRFHFRKKAYGKLPLMRFSLAL